jgi:hypothetical protein
MSQKIGFVADLLVDLDCHISATKFEFISIAKHITPMSLASFNPLLQACQFPQP